ncbi:MAG: hypothetical protein RL685_6450 [Pseudomonadota bacterium]
MRSRLLRKYAVLAVAVSGVLLGVAATAKPAAACSCAGYPEVESSLRDADVVFEGTVLALPEPVQAPLGYDRYTGAVRVRFQVARYYKGQRGSEVALYTIDQDSACGRYFDFRGTYVVYGRVLENGLLTDSSCSRTRLLSEAAEDLALLGEGAAPDPSVLPRDVVADQEEDDAGCSVAAGVLGGREANATGGALGGALLLALAFLRRRSVSR